MLVHDTGPVADALAKARSHGVAVLRLPPAADMQDAVLAAAATGRALVLAPSLARARHVGLRLRRAGVDTAILPEGWPAARAGATVVVGSRAAAWAPAPGLSAVVVLDEHDEVYQEERAPTWHARDVAVERARRAGAPCLLVSPVPSLEALRLGPLVTVSRSDERAGWPPIDVVDRRNEDPLRGGMISERLSALVRAGAQTVCVLNRKGRARLLACLACGELCRCEHCESAVSQTETAELQCARCGTTRPAVCQSCTSSRLKTVRAGIGRVREELEAITGEQVVEVTGDNAGNDLAPSRLYVGTEAVLHQVARAELVAFLDFDQELLAPRYRASEQALALLVRAARLVGGRHSGGRVLVQTRLPHHEAIQAALRADPSRVASVEAERRRLLRFPPEAAMAVISGAAAERFVAALSLPPGAEISGPSDGRWLLRAPDHQMLCDVLASTPRPSGRLRVEVDPLRI